jgi:hypothetical protein
LIELSQSTAQQLAVMELLTFLEGLHSDLPRPLAAGTRRIEIDHDLILFQMTGDASPPHKEIPPGAYEIEESMHRHRRWIKLAGEDWGNAEMCWEAVRADRQPASSPSKKGFFWQITRMHQAIANVFKRKPRIQRQAEAKKLFQEAKQFIRREEWHKALPLLQQASASDPDHYEIAYRWLNAVRHTSSNDAAEQALNLVLQQSRWTPHEEQMLRELLRPLRR